MSSLDLQPPQALPSHPARLPRLRLEPAPPRVDAAVALWLDARLRALAREEASGRRALGELAWELRRTKAFVDLGFVSLSDWARERLGVSGSEVDCAARVAERMRRLPLLASAFEAGELSWTKARLLVAAVSEKDEAEWLARAKPLTTRELEEAIREERKEGKERKGREETRREKEERRESDGEWEEKEEEDEDEEEEETRERVSREVDAVRAEATGPDAVHEAVRALDAVHAGGWGVGREALRELEAVRAEDGEEVDGEVRVGFRMSVPGRVRVLFRQVVEIARRALGGPAPLWQCVEAIAAEASCGPRVLELEEPAAAAGVDSGARAPSSRGPEGLPGNDRRPEPPRSWLGLSERELASPEGASEAELGDRLGLSAEELRDTAPAELMWLSGETSSRRSAQGGVGRLHPAELGPRGLDARMREVVRGMARVEWKIGRLLSLLYAKELHLSLGFGTKEDYAREALGISIRKAQALLAVEGVGRRCAELESAYRCGRMSWARAVTILPVIREADRETARAWVERAGEVTLRVLSDQVAWALERRDLGELARRNGPPPVEARLGKLCPKRLLADAQLRRELGSCVDRVVIEVSGPASVIGLWRAAVLAWTDPAEPLWRGLERLLLHVLGEWASTGRHRDPVFERDGWRCLVPACSAMRELEDHHREFRSRGGTNDLWNRLAACHRHHHYGVHEGRIRASGKAPDAIVWELGTGGGREPFLVLRGDVYVGGAGEPVTHGARGGASAQATGHRSVPGAGDVARAVSHRPAEEASVS